MPASKIEVYGNDEPYNLHLRSADTRIVWQSYRATFLATPRWRALRLPFDQFKPYRIDKPLDTSRLRRISLVAIGRVMTAHLCFARVTLYPEVQRGQHHAHAPSPPHRPRQPPPGLQ